MGSVEAELWNIFTYYTLHGNALDPEHLALTQMVQLARDVQLLDGTLIKTPLRKPDIELVFISLVKKRTLGKGAQVNPDSGLSNSVDKLTYNEFLTCLLKLSSKLYPTSAEQSAEAAFQQLLMENVLPLASRRSPKSIDAVLHEKSVVDLFKYFKQSLTKIFEYYASSGMASAKEKASYRGFQAESKNFDELRGETKAKLDKGAGLVSSDMSLSSSMRSKQNSMTSAMGYADFIRFASDFGLTSKGSSLTMIDIGDLYLAGVANAGGTHHGGVRKLRFQDFWEVINRVALQAYKKCAVNHCDKTKGLLLYMWRQVQTNVGNAMGKNVQTLRSSNKGGLLKGSQDFSREFIAMWQNEGFKDYLYPKKAAPAEGRTVLSKLIAGENVKADRLPPPPSDGIRYELEIEDDDSSVLEGHGIQPDKLRALLAKKPEIVRLLQQGLQEIGLDD
ncbi:hypothetical protein TL16_g08085 [Triparma laevis f. inornata]|uniref:Uncharacterized protein n=2 Tax=Triparma laevis TaxID=1534972 RepID=A0A9W7DNL8_9STRA|nr:hypothetical protein TrLO_g13916 [Triparma laevis f. longispina]GMH79267.1 hypothetical protein TL16_g08085 [Triparma laevis f. inornata]